MGRLHLALPLAAVISLFAALPAGAQLPGVVDLTVPAARETDPVILTGKDLGSWATPANQTARLPLQDLLCFGVEPQGGDPTSGGADAVTDSFNAENCPHNDYVKPEVDTADVAAPAGTDVDKLYGFKWDPRARRFAQIPFQVDEVFTRYLNNGASGFSPYSGEDQHTTYAYDREGFRWYDQDAKNPCLARPASAVATDPVKGLDHNDELAFMMRDTSVQAPSGSPRPAGIEAMQEIRVADPANPTAPVRFVYVGRAGSSAPTRQFTAANGYVKYQRDANADTFAFSQSSYDGYGNAREGTYCDANGNIVMKDGKPAIGRRRPRDTATITTARYRYRYDGRWLMTKVEISPDEGRTYGPDLVDRWKARAFAQDPGSETPCCGYEEEDTNWGGSSTLLGERVGPVRAIRETWGADSGTNVIRRETFYRDTMRQKTWLRVHVIPPLDGIYAQWDFNAGAVDTFFNSKNPSGVAVDGKNDEKVFGGNFDDPCNGRYDNGDDTQVETAYRNVYQSLAFDEDNSLCGRFPYHQSIDPSDPTFSDANASLGWAMVTGDRGTIVDRVQTTLDNSAGGTAQGVAAVPYYRDDSCFDDGTGTNPGPKVKLRSGDEPSVSKTTGGPRKCWAPGDPASLLETDAYYQGSIATHGLHLLFLADSDNARQTVPVTEIVSDWSMVMLPGRRNASAGEQYGRGFEKPLVATVTPVVG
jgi:hypothetical protein